MPSEVLRSIGGESAVTTVRPGGQEECSGADPLPDHLKRQKIQSTHGIDAPFTTEVERYLRNLGTKISHQEPSDARHLRAGFDP
jgi:hypothetical protein